MRGCRGRMSVKGGRPVRRMGCWGSVGIFESQTLGWGVRKWLQHTAVAASCPSRQNSLQYQNALQQNLPFHGQRIYPMQPTSQASEAMTLIYLPVCLALRTTDQAPQGAQNPARKTKVYARMKDHLPPCTTTALLRVRSQSPARPSTAETSHPCTCIEATGS